MELEVTNPQTKVPNKTWIAVIAIIILVAITGIFLLLVKKYNPSSNVLSPIAQFTQNRPLDAYTFDALAQRKSQPSNIIIEETIKEEKAFTSHIFSFQTDNRKITGQINLPVNYLDQKLPAVVMLRGWIDPNEYQTGDGTKNAAQVFASKGYITIAPDFAGYGGSDYPDSDTFTARLQKPVTVLDLLESVKNLDYVDTDNLFIWAHSNGGQIALSVLEITGQPYPTTLWAPVSKPFPYSILYYTDEADDYGKALRKSLAHFEETYDTDLYSIHNYLDRITAPIQIHQGGKDNAIPLEWSNELVESLASMSKKKEASDSAGIDITYYKYPGADHNLNPNWNTVVNRDLSFFSKHIQ